MIVLGVHDGHNASAALLRDGVLVGAAQEERFTRVKNQGGMPKQAIEDVLKSAGVGWNDVDVFAVADKTSYFLDWSRESILQLLATGGHNTARVWAGRARPVRAFRRQQLQMRRQQHLQEHGFPSKRTVVLEHHHCHAAAAYYGQGRIDQPVLVLTADGVGDFLSATVSIADGGRINRIASVPDLYSLGMLYAKVTYLMGMVPLEHEHKIMGLAPYGAKSTDQVTRIKKKFADLYQFNSDGLTWKMRSASRTMAASLGFLQDLIYRERFDCLAAGLQEFLEEMVVTWVQNCIRKTGIRDVALGGGLFMNVKANKKILESPEVDSLYVMPSSGDETNAIGAAYSAHASRRLGSGLPVDVEPLGHLYLGRGITDDEAQQALSSQMAADFRWDRPRDPEEEVARLLAAGKVVARAAGPMEFGARALGNRSILADPSRRGVASLINDMIKDRDFWMPFAPSVLAERASQYFEKPKPVLAPYMALTFDSHREKWEFLAAASHPTDHTIRPQEVLKEWNAPYHRLLSCFSDVTGEAAILNTSFNLHGFPIVCTATDALDVFSKSGLEVMQLGSFVVRKPARVSEDPRSTPARIST